MRLVTATIGLVFVGCGASQSPSQADVARRTYEAEQAACVVTYESAPEIDACRATVRRLWGQPARVPSGALAPSGGLLLRDGGF
jgi:hypothetical protein